MLPLTLVHSSLCFLFYLNPLKHLGGMGVVPVVVSDEFVLLRWCVGGCWRVPSVLCNLRVRLNEHSELQIFTLVHLHWKTLDGQFRGQLRQQSDIGLVWSGDRKQCFFNSASVLQTSWLLIMQQTFLWLTYNKQVCSWAVHTCFICSNAGNVSCVRKVHSRDSQNALYVQTVFSTGTHPLLYCWSLTKKGEKHHGLNVLKKWKKTPEMLHTHCLGGVLPGDIVVEVRVVSCADNPEFLTNYAHIFIRLKEDKWRETEL